MPLSFCMSISSLTNSPFSCTKRRLACGSVANRCSSYFSHMIFFLRVCSTRSVSCSTLIRACSFLAPKSYAALFVGMGAISLAVRLTSVVSPSRACCLVVFFAVESLPVCRLILLVEKKGRSSSNTPDCKLT